MDENGFSHGFLLVFGSEKVGGLEFYGESKMNQNESDISKKVFQSPDICLVGGFNPIEQY